MKMTPRVRKILSWYESDNPGTKANLARILMQGAWAGRVTSSSCRLIRVSNMGRRAALRPTRPPMILTITSSSPSTPGFPPMPRC
jgi:hypothetical protein